MRKKKKSGARSGIINGILNFLSEKILNLAKNGFLGKLFSSDALEVKSSHGVVIGNMDAIASGEVGGFRRNNLKLIDESVFSNTLKRIFNYFATCALNWYGVYFLIFALYSLLLYLVKEIVVQNGAVSASVMLGENFIVPIFIIIAAIPLMRSDDSLKSAVFHSGLIRPFLENFGGLSEDKFEDVEPTNKATGYFAAITLGILTGSVTYFASSLNVLLIVLAVLAISFVLHFPELGVIITIFAFPLLGFLKHPTAILLGLVIVDLAAYLGKVFIGKRVFRFRLMDAIVSLFGFLFLMGGIITSGGIDSFKAAATYFALMAIYFLVVNLFNTKEWLYRAVTAIALPSVFVSLYGIIGYAAGNFQARWLDLSMFSEITNRAISVFENPNMLATYLVLTAPFIWICMLNEKLSTKLRACAALGSLSSAFCIILTWSRGAWIGMIAAIILFSLIIYKHSLKYWLVIGLTSPFWVKIVPKNVMTRFMSIGNLGDSSTYYRLYTWKGSLKLLYDYWIGGIGVGESAFSQIYPLYSYVGIETTAHSHNVFLQIAIEMGVVALAIFLILMFLTVQKAFWSFKNASDTGIKMFVAASLSGLIAALAHGMVDYIWYNYRVFFAFWLLVAFVCAGAEVCRKEKARGGVHASGMRERAPTLDIIFG